MIVDEIFATKKLNNKGIEKMERIKMSLQKCLEDVYKYLPEGRSKALFTTKMEEAGFYATKSMTQDPDNQKKEGL